MFELPCPECDRLLATVETLRVHRWLAHDVHEFPPAVTTN